MLTLNKWKNIQFNLSEFTFSWLIDFDDTSTQLGLFNTPHGANCTATYLISRKLYKLDEPDMPDTAGEAKTRS